MKSIKDAHELQKENSKDEHKAWKDGASDHLLKIDASSMHLRSATRRIHKLQTPGSEHAGPGELELPKEWWGESQVACIVKHTCINKSVEKHVEKIVSLSIVTQEQAERQ